MTTATRNHNIRKEVPYSNRRHLHIKSPPVSCKALTNRRKLKIIVTEGSSGREFDHSSCFQGSHTPTAKSAYACAAEPCFRAIFLLIVHTTCSD
mmetsp:Transcript_15852/g.34151  ORF Transcript_15852/g.34151 Transcript_15852/m.34151 type:complete len:94 (+) Transcript_15852:1589-1870(+)